MEDVRDYLDEQQFRYETLNDGKSFKVFPKTSHQPLVMVRTSHDPNAVKNVHAQLRRIGVEIPHRAQKAKEPTMTTLTRTNGHGPLQTLPPAEVVQQSPFATIRHHIDAALDHLAEAQEMLNHQEARSAKLNQLRELLRDGL
jgi:hypothetical protein